MKRWFITGTDTEIGKTHVANPVDPDMQALSENLKTLQKLMPVPLLATLAWNSSILQIADL